MDTSGELQFVAWGRIRLASARSAERPIGRPGIAATRAMRRRLARNGRPIRRRRGRRIAISIGAGAKPIRRSGVLRICARFIESTRLTSRGYSKSRETSVRSADVTSQPASITRIARAECEESSAASATQGSGSFVTIRRSSKLRSRTSRRRRCVRELEQRRSRLPRMRRLRSRSGRTMPPVRSAIVA